LNAHIVVVAYTLAEDLYNLYASCAHPDIHFHIFLHSRFPDVVTACEQIAERPQVTLYPYGVNRGLATSWNEGLINAYAVGADVALIANDDAIAAPGDALRIAEAAIDHREKYMVSGMGVDLATGERKDMLFSLAAVNPVALDTIGYFDQNFYPIYFEDIDWYTRAKLAGLERMCIPTTNLIHAGSKSRHALPANNAQHEQTFPRNRAYYGRKWGCADQGTETYTVPFHEARFTLKITAEDRHAPYPGFNRTDHEVVTV
jgi:GT2 family glycosyltransferase